MIWSELFIRKKGVLRALPHSLAVAVLFFPIPIPVPISLPEESIALALRDFHNGIPSVRPSAPNCNLLVAPRAH